MLKDHVQNAVECTVGSEKIYQPQIDKQNNERMVWPCEFLQDCCICQSVFQIVSEQIWCVSRFQVSVLISKDEYLILWQIFYPLQATLQ